MVDAHLNSPSLCLSPPLLAVVFGLEMWHTQPLPLRPTLSNINYDTLQQGLFLSFFNASINCVLIQWARLTWSVTGVTREELALPGKSCGHGPKCEHPWPVIPLWLLG